MSVFFGDLNFLFFLFSFTIMDLGFDILFLKIFFDFCSRLFGLSIFLNLGGLGSLLIKLLVKEILRNFLF